MAAIPRALERYPLGARLDGALDAWRANDRDRGAPVTVTRVAFGPERRAERDDFVERVRALFAVTAPALITALDAGAWDDDAFVVEEAVVEPAALPEGVAALDARERALAARSLAEGFARLHEAGWSIDALAPRDVVIDAYRQPRLSMALRVVPASEATRRDDVERLRTIVSSWTSVGEAASADDLARSIRVPESASRPLLPTAAPPAASRLPWLLVALVVIAIVVVLATR